MRAFAVLAMLILASCAHKNAAVVPAPPATAKPIDLTGAPFTLNAMLFKGKDIPLPETRRPTMQFSGTNRVSGLAGVNRYSGEVTITGSEGITFGPVAATKMAGPSDAMALETNFLGLLATVTRFDYREGKLLLTGADRSSALVLTR